MTKIASPEPQRSLVTTKTGTKKEYLIIPLVKLYYDFKYFFQGIRYPLVSPFARDYGKKSSLLKSKGKIRVTREGLSSINNLIFRE